MRIIIRMATVLAIMVAVTISAQETTVLELKDFSRTQYDEKAFMTKGVVTIHIKAEGASDRWADEMFAYGWILDASTRQVIWKMTVDKTKEMKNEFLRSADESIKLKPGRYEVYFAAFPIAILKRDYRDLGDFVDGLLSGFKKNKTFQRYADRWGIWISVAEKDQDKIGLVPMDGSKDAIVSIKYTGDDEYIQEGFTLSGRTRVRIYALGEGVDGDMYDYGWIINDNSGETVWEMKYRDTKWAGGAEKNRLADENITLPAGDYIVTYVTDDSHSYNNWNMLPPLDPRFWGITIWPEDPSILSSGRVKKYLPRISREPIISISRVGDDYFEERGFRLNHAADVRVRCLGESSGRVFVDGGYIVDASTYERVWEMTRRNTRHAGGASKNRMFDGIVKLDKGIYEVFYYSDDSHSYRSWNDAAPYNPSAWGITIWGGSGFKEDWVEPYDESDDKDVLVSLVKMYDDERRREKFTLKREARVRIYALGEGDRNELYDYGWIEDQDGDIVWKMRPEECHSAGGAIKNRMVNQVIDLPAGTYTAYYRTDGSHSFERWNDDPPFDPVHWGISVRLEEQQ